MICEQCKHSGYLYWDNHMITEEFQFKKYMYMEKLWLPGPLPPPAPFCTWSSLVRVPPPRTVAPLSGEELFTGFMSCLAISSSNITFALCFNVHTS